MQENKKDNFIKIRSKLMNVQIFIIGFSNIYYSNRSIYVHN